ncbi:hypothetical protein [Actinopolymorpha rutila]|uniref:Uncharacterized protein n=1 Tax=Actinopolymorpha rutila TaxID=446787 RepID=A0A852ZJ31_9ACTN|nr:hypothetical protein [Actinopolymorpha rutila]NYH92974.1 hypothetical protein [Actinopolymorpha rutila]
MVDQVTSSAPQQRNLDNGLGEALERAGSDRIRRWLPFAAAVGVLFVGSISFGIGYAAGKDDAKPPAAAALPASPAPTATTAEEPATVEEDTSAPEPGYSPVAEDFKLTLRTLKKACFGSAGCNISYRVDMGYLGTETPDASVTYEVTYEG